MTIRTPADMNPAIATAIGRFSQVCNYLEQHLIFIITRLLPLTADMGMVLLAGNQMRRNIGVLKALMELPNIPISDADRSRLKSLVPRLTDINEDRSRFLHSRMVGGFQLSADEPPSDLHLMVQKQDGKGAPAHPISVELINSRTEEARSVWSALYINPVEYDLSVWERSFQRYAPRPYPSSDQPSPARSQDQRKNDLQQSKTRKVIKD